MRITFRQLVIFSQVAETLNYTKAAEILCLTQPAVSMQVRQLEDQVGITLLDYSGKQIILTEAGELFLQYTHTILNTVDEARIALKALKNTKHKK